MESGGMERDVCPSCGYVHYRNPAPCVSVLIEGDAGFLVGKRAEGSIYAGLWCLPCGYIENDETFFEAASRESLEETGMAVQPTRIVNVVSNRLAGDVRSLVVVILARPLPPGQVAVAGDDLCELRWIGPDESLPDMAFAADVHIIGVHRAHKTAGTKMPGIDFDETVYSFDQEGLEGRWQ
jgi:8-oxo-dGTP pyrophosphatase MutT (NUDIX family)